MAKLSLALTLAICASAATLAHAQTEKTGDPVVHAADEPSIAESLSQSQKPDEGKDKSAKMTETIKSGEPDADVRIIIETLQPAVVVSHVREGTAPFALEIVQPAFAGSVLIDYNHTTELPLMFSDKRTLLSEEAKQALVPLGHALRSEELKSHNYLIGVHTDAQGDAVYNDQLSHFRAEAIKAFLVDAFAIDEARLVTVGWGERKLKYPSSPLSTSNQRLEVSLISDTISDVPGQQPITVWSFKDTVRKFVLNADDLRQRFSSYGWFGHQMPRGMVDASIMDCQRKVANDPRPLVHHLDDFNTGRTPLNCETGGEPRHYGSGRIIIR